MFILQRYFLIFFLILTFDLQAKQKTFSSDGKKAIFIELFTSQGCSSCPPAEKYLNKFLNSDELWSKYIPVAFHVDYWDYIGWKDVFAKSEFASRQYRYANLKHVRTVYTPAFVVNGSSWRRGFFNSYPQVQGLSSGKLNVIVDGDSVSATFKMKPPVDDVLQLNIAILGTQMTVKITAGENDGRKSEHSFAVLGYKKQLSDSMQWKLTLPKIKKTNSKRNAFVAWISRKNNPTPVQAVGGWLEDTE